MYQDKIFEIPVSEAGDVVGRMNYRGRPVPVIQMPQTESGAYLFVAPEGTGYFFGVSLPPYVAMVAMMNRRNILTEKEGDESPTVQGTEANFFMAPEYFQDEEYAEGCFSWLNRARWNSYEFHMQGAECVLEMYFYLPANWKDEQRQPAVGTTWWGNPIRSKEDRDMDERAMRVGQSEPRPIPAPYRPAYWDTEPAVVVIFQFWTVERFNELAEQNGIPQWDPYGD